MKRIKLISLVSLILTGCGDDKVTKEYLVGDWDCNNVKYESKYDPKFKEYDDYSLESTEHFKHTYKIVDGVLIVKLPSDEAVVDLDKIYTQLTIEGKREDCEHTINRSLIKNSSNKFTFEMEMFFTCSNENGEVTKSKSKRERICTRIK
ncbi:hypothetical protein [uncultured Gilliamella sp.]|uniref:hypothetical protein n=1 Tax=uncultured Gilliamella sp. TaxID=1193505 RepID=UPI0025DB3A66|nr:hypothetical protein [uncultured Gilliamella sp.]